MNPCTTEEGVRLEDIVQKCLRQSQNYIRRSVLKNYQAGDMTVTTMTRITQNTLNTQIQGNSELTGKQNTKNKKTEFRIQNSAHQFVKSQEYNGLSGSKETKTARQSSHLRSVELDDIGLQVSESR